MQILFHLMANTGCLPDKVVPQIPTNRMKGECLLDITKKWLEEE